MSVLGPINQSRTVRSGDKVRVSSLSGGGLSNPALPIGTIGRITPRGVRVILPSRTELPMRLCNANGEFLSCKAGFVVLKPREPVFLVDSQNHAVLELAATGLGDDYIQAQVFFSNARLDRIESRLVH